MKKLLLPLLVVGLLLSLAVGGYQCHRLLEYREQLTKLEMRLQDEFAANELWLAEWSNLRKVTSWVDAHCREVAAEIASYTDHN